MSCAARPEDLLKAGLSCKSVIVFFFNDPRRCCYHRMTSARAWWSLIKTLFNFSEPSASISLDLTECTVNRVAL